MRQTSSSISAVVASDFHTPSPTKRWRSRGIWMRRISRLNWIRSMMYWTPRQGCWREWHDGLVKGEKIWKGEEIVDVSIGWLVGIGCWQISMINLWIQPRCWFASAGQRETLWRCETLHVVTDQRHMFMLHVLACSCLYQYNKSQVPYTINFWGLGPWWGRRNLHIFVGRW